MTLWNHLSGRVIWEGVTQICNTFVVLSSVFRESMKNLNLIFFSLMYLRAYGHYSREEYIPVGIQPSFKARKRRQNKTCLNMFSLDRIISSPSTFSRPALKYMLFSLVFIVHNNQFCILPMQLLLFSIVNRLVRV